MKSFLLLISFILPFGLWAQAQLEFSPDLIEVVDDSDEFEIVGYANLTNTGDQPISIIWKRVIVDIPDQWISQVCDNNQCYAPEVSSNVDPDLNLNAPVTLQPGGSTNMDVHIRPNQVEGTSEIKVEVASTENPDSVLVTATYNISTSLATSVSEEAAVQGIRLFPNPAVRTFRLSDHQGIRAMRLYNVLGREVRTWNVHRDQEYQVGDLPKGVYLLSLLDEQGKIMRTIRLAKASSRP